MELISSVLLMAHALLSMAFSAKAKIKGTTKVARAAGGALLGVCGARGTRFRVASTQ